MEINRVGCNEKRYTQNRYYSSGGKSMKMKIQMKEEQTQQSKRGKTNEQE